MRSDSLMKILRNVSWLAFDRVLRVVVGVFIGAWLARYLGPDRYGAFSYAIAFFLLFTPIANLGMTSIVVRELVREPTEGEATVKAAFLLHLIGSVFAAALATAIIVFVRDNQDIVVSVVAIISISSILNCSAVIKYWYEAQVRSHIVVWLDTATLFVRSMMTVYLIATEATLINFAFLFLLESLMSFILLLSVYRVLERKKLFGLPDYRKIWTIARDSFPLMLSSAAILVYMRVDQIMLGELLNDSAVGVYSVAVKISEISYVVPIIVVASIFPNILQLKNYDNALYKIRIQNLLSLIFVLTMSFGLLTTIFGSLIVSTLFGPAYSQAGYILMIHIWSCVFVGLGVVGNSWYLAENLEKIILTRVLVGTVANIILNFLLIPKYGGIGAAYATLISQAISAYLMDLASKSTWFIFFAKTKALLISPLIIARMRS